MSSFWAEACDYAYNIKPLQLKLDNSYISCGVTVRCVIAFSTWLHFVRDFCCLSDCRVLRVRASERDHAYSVAAVGLDEPEAWLEALWMVLRPNFVRQLLWCCDLGRLDAAYGI